MEQFKDIEIEKLQKHLEALTQANQQIKKESFEKSQECYNAILWLAAENSKLANVIMEAKEGKIDSYILNEQEIMLQYLN